MQLNEDRRPAIYFSETHLCGTCLAPFIREMITFPSPDRDMLLAPPSFLDPVYPSQLARSIRCNRERPPWTGEKRQNTSLRETKNYVKEITCLNRVFSRNVKAAILVSQNNETAAMLVSQTSPLGVELFSYANAFFWYNKFAYMLATWVKTLCWRRSKLVMKIICSN